MSVTLVHDVDAPVQRYRWYVATRTVRYRFVEGENAATVHLSEDGIDVWRMNYQRLSLRWQDIVSFSRVPVTA